MVKKAAKRVAPKRATTSAKSTTTTKATKATKRVTRPVTKEVKKDQFGLVEGSDRSIVMNTLVEGGAGKPAVLELVTNRIKKSSGLTTSSGRPKNISAIVSASIARLKEEGYIIESTWQMVPKPKRDRKTAAK